MYVTYNNLFKLLIDKGLNKTEFAREVGISSNTLAKLSKNELVSLEVLVRICRQLDCSLGDMVQQCLTDPKYAQGRDAARAQTWVYPGEGAVRAADYLEQKVKELTATHEEKEP